MMKGRSFFLHSILSHREDVSIHVRARTTLLTNFPLPIMFGTINSVDTNSSTISFSVVFILHTSPWYLKVSRVYEYVARSSIQLTDVSRLQADARGLN